MSLAEYRAIRDAILASPRFPAGKLYEGRASTTDGKPITGTWYVVMQSGETTDRQERMTGPYATEEVTEVFQCVGTTVEQTLGVVRDLDSILRPGGRGLQIIVPGRTVQPLRRTYVAGVQSDSDISPPLWWQTVEYTYRSRPA